MARTTVALQTLPYNGNAPITFGAPDIVNGNQFVNDNDVLLVLMNTAGTAATVTVSSVADSEGRVGDMAITVPAAVSSVPGMVSTNVLTRSAWNQKTSGNLGKVFFMASTATGLYVACVEISGRK